MSVTFLFFSYTAVIRSLIKEKIENNDLFLYSGYSIISLYAVKYLAPPYKSLTKKKLYYEQSLNKRIIVHLEIITNQSWPNISNSIINVAKFSFFEMI